MALDTRLGLDNISFELMKGVLLILLFSGQLEYRSFDYQPRDWDSTKGFSDSEIVLSCSERAEELYEEIATHSWDDPRGHGYYLNDKTGTIQGHIC